VFGRKSWEHVFGKIRKGGDVFMRGEDVQAAYAKTPEGLFLQSADKGKSHGPFAMLVN
jgi:hypothetical protein